LKRCFFFFTYSEEPKLSLPNFQQLGKYENFNLDLKNRILGRENREILYWLLCYVKNTSYRGHRVFSLIFCKDIRDIVHIFETVIVTT
jgi:hypothetical protein